MRIATVRTGVALLRRRFSTQDAANNETEEPQKGHVDGRIFHPTLYVLNREQSDELQLFALAWLLFLLGVCASCNGTGGEKRHLMRRREAP
jgi:hypothetical protein